MDKDVHALFDPWRNLNRPGNNVLENYEVTVHTEGTPALPSGNRQARSRLDTHDRARVDLGNSSRDMDAAALEVESAGAADTWSWR